MSLSQDAVIRALNSYSFRNIWNAPTDECGVNLQLHLVSQRFATNHVISGQMSLTLPVAGEQYAVFWANYALFEDSLIIPPDTWIAADQLGQTHQTLFHVYSETGLMLPKASVLIYHNASSNRVFVVVKKIPLLKIVGIVAWSQLYLSVYKYSASSNQPLTISSRQVTIPDTGHLSSGPILAAIATALISVPYGTFVYVNGYDHPPGETITLLPGDYVDIYTDTTVFGIYTVNMTTTMTGYFSPTYQEYKEVLHCPKALNPNNRIMPTQMLTLTARRNSDHVGCFIHRNDLNGLIQITHSDVGISTDIVNAYRESLNHADISIEVRLRAHDTYLVREASYIRYLYLCDDATILTFLIGHGDPSLPFWTAAALEQTSYVVDMISTPALNSPQTLAGYVTALGYYTTIAAICQYNKTFLIDILPATAISVKKPLVLSGLQSYPVVYLNGIKLRESQVDYANDRHDKIVFSLTSDVYTQIGQTLTVDLLESGTSIPYLFTPTSDTPAITVPYDSITLYQVNTPDTPIIGYLVSTDTSYTHVLTGPGNPATTSNTVDGGTVVTFQSAAYGTPYLIQNARYSRCYSVDITSQVAALSPIHLELTTLCSDTTTVAPLLGYHTLLVYLNGRRMIAGIDYSANPMTDADGNTAIIQLLICNRSALHLSGTNYLEVIAHTGVDMSSAIGYVTNNTINIRNNIETWYSGLSMAFANGYLLVNPVDAGDEIIPSASVDNGLPFLLSSIIPGFVPAALSDITSTSDNNRIMLINTYLNEQPPINDTSMLIIPKSWQVYSPYLTAIIHDVIQPGQTLIYTNDPDQTLFRLQFAEYDYLLDNDPCLDVTRREIDLRYCDIYPAYDTVHVPDLNTYTILRRLAGILLPADTDTLGDVVND